MEAKQRQAETRDHNISADEQNRSRIVHRIGAPDSGLFPGWGPRL